ncbi:MULTISPECIES: hypothetical protein [Priestia]|uniref:ABC transporter periplasmic binding protein yphF n=1 Tax=Priestia veravalensis TaxID=1414648 RepID=A0A0V8JRA9_9BACI|nr:MULTISPECIES: hypothetical protein [Priestia]KSU89514.1 hypothetical protein AS180_01510 [Priestia veravalensis]SCB80455.1 hypothetical protein GA0061087_1001314 [Priestia flexa]
MRKILLFIIFCSITFLLSACLYPEANLSQNQVPYKDQLAAVQQAVDDFQKDSGGLLPIKTRDNNTPIYQKYPIEFNKLSPRYMQEPPGTAFESGGVFSYMLVDVEENPTVKLIDLRMAEQIKEVNIYLNLYRQKHSGYAPFKEVIADGVFSIDYKKLNMKEPPTVVSPYSGQLLPLVLNGKGELFVDYSSDLYEVLQKHKHTYKEGEDIRNLLVEHSSFVPAYSLPYTIDEKTNEPIFLEK